MTEHILDIVIDERNFQGFCNMITSTIDLNISLERQVYLSDYNIRFDSRCDYYQEVYKPGVCFASILVRMYINYVLRCLFELDLTLRDERILVEEVILFASELMYEFFNSTSYLFFHEFFKLCCLEDLNLSCCYGILRQKVHYGPIS